MSILLWFGSKYSGNIISGKFEKTKKNSGHATLFPIRSLVVVKCERDCRAKSNTAGLTLSSLLVWSVSTSLAGRSGPGGLDCAGQPRKPWFTMGRGRGKAQAFCGVSLSRELGWNIKSLLPLTLRIY